MITDVATTPAATNDDQAMPGIHTRLDRDDSTSTSTTDRSPAPKAPHRGARLIDDVFDALGEQTVAVPGAGTLDIVIPTLASSRRPFAPSAGPWKPTLFSRS